MSISRSRPLAAVIGAGVIGLAAARTLALKGKEVVILEAECAFGTGTSSRNSEVIHAGIYYAPRSIKASACVTGKNKLYEYCERKGVPHKRIGKLIVATNKEEISALAKIKAQAVANGVTDLQDLSEACSYIQIQNADVRVLEPHVNAVAGLFSPSTGIVDSHAYMTALLGDAEDAGAVLSLHSKVVGGQIQKDGSISVEVEDTAAAAGHTYRLDADIVVNAAGLNAVKIANILSPELKSVIPKAYFCKGNYFALAGVKNTFKHLVYPIPNSAGLGVHLTLDMDGNARFGPDTQWIKDIEYSVSSASIPSFEIAIRNYWPDLPSGALVPSYSGIRPKIVGPQHPAADFLILSPVNTKARLVHLLGIESPGLTASLALADMVEHAI